MSDFRIKAYPVGQIDTNCYVIYRESLQKAVIVDPGDEGVFLLGRLKKLSVTPEAILLTHGHFDHIMAVRTIKDAYPECKIYAGKMEKDLLEDPAVNLSANFGKALEIKADRYHNDQDVLSLAGISFRVLFTPGHTGGSVCYLVEEEGVLISGDTLFFQSLGRTDLPTGDQHEIINSIKEKLYTLPEDTMVYPGHGEITTIGHEKVYNPVALYRE